MRWLSPHFLIWSSFFNIENVTSLTWPWNLSVGWFLVVLFNKAPAVRRQPCFSRPRQKNEPVVWYSSSSELLWDLAGSGLAQSEEHVSTCVDVYVSRVSCVCRTSPHGKCNESLPLKGHIAPVATLQRCPVGRCWLVVAVHKDKRKDGEHKTDGMSLKRANIATKQKPRQTVKRRMKRAWECIDGNHSVHCFLCVRVSEGGKPLAPRSHRCQLDKEAF